MLRTCTRLSPLFVALALTGCGGKVERTDSTVKGNFELNSFPSKVVALEAINEKGGVTRAEVDASGAFSIGLARGHKYQVRVILANGSEPMVFPRADGSLDLDFKVSTGAAVLALGKVNHFASAPPTGFVVSGNSSGEGEVGECVDGHLMGTGEACVDDDAEVVRLLVRGEERQDRDGRLVELGMRHDAQAEHLGVPRGHSASNARAGMLLARR